MSERYIVTEEDIKRDEEQRRVHVESLVRLTLEAGWLLGMGGHPKPDIDMWWDEDGNAHVHFKKQARQPLLTRIFGALRTSL